tara:strand:+ start:2004 stop:2225 length:222 start_codon:yes stop_codon:yes gene_type:complete
MKIIHHTRSGHAEIKFSWKEIWTIVKNRKLTLTPEGLQSFGAGLLNIIMEWNLQKMKKVEEKDVVDPNDKTDK